MPENTPNPVLVRFVPNSAVRIVESPKPPPVYRQYRRVPPSDFADPSFVSAAPWGRFPTGPAYDTSGSRECPSCFEGLGAEEGSMTYASLGTHHGRRHDLNFVPSYGFGQFDPNIGNRALEEAAKKIQSGFPWRQESPQTRQYQGRINQWLLANDYTAIATDGKLGPGTCAAWKLAVDNGANLLNPAPYCQSYGTPPPKKGAARAAPRPAPAPSAPDVGPPPPKQGWSTTTWIMVATGVAAAGVVGYAIYKKRMRKR